MRKMIAYLIFACLLLPTKGRSEIPQVWTIVDENGIALTAICETPGIGDTYITAQNQLYEIIHVSGETAVAALKGAVQLPPLDWMNVDAAVPVLAKEKRIALYCTHSDESYSPSDGYYTTLDRGTIYQVAQKLADELKEKGIEALVSDQLHHPHDAGAYRRSRQTAIQLLKHGIPDCLIDVHRDGIPDPDAYNVVIAGEHVSKIRILVGRGNQNADANKEFALLIKAVADHVYPGLIKDIYLGKGTFNQDLLPQSVLFECGTFTLEKEKVLRSMSLMADVLNRALYGGVLGSAGQMVSDVKAGSKETGDVTMGEPDSAGVGTRSSGSGFGFLGILLLIGIPGIAILSAGSVKGGMKKAGRNLNEMTGGLFGKQPEDNENPKHS